MSFENRVCNEVLVKFQILCMSVWTLGIYISYECFCVAFSGIKPNTERSCVEDCRIAL